MAGLFDTFTVAKRGLNVQQGNINTSSHNIANAQTVGYSRQRATVHTTRPFGGMSRFDSCSVGQVGTGAEITQIMRIRDSFLDYQVRTETTNYGTANIKNQYLYQVEDILNETTSTGVQGALSAFYNAFQELSKSPQKDSNRTVALQQASALADALNSRYTQLENKKEDAQKELSEYVTDINKMLDQINDLNKQISSVVAVGMTPNDLMDSRDYLIDELSSKFGVKIDKQQRETIDLSVSEDSAIGNLVNSNPNDSNYARFSYVENAVVNGNTLTVTYNVLGDKNNQKTIEITDTDTNKLEELKNNLLQDRILVGDKDGLVSNSTNITLDSSTPDTTPTADEDKIIQLLKNIKDLNDIDRTATPLPAGVTVNKDGSITKSETVGTKTTTITINKNGVATITESNENPDGTKTDTQILKATIDKSGNIIASSNTSTIDNITTAITIKINKDGDASKLVKTTPASTLNLDDMDSKIFNNVTKGEIAGNQQVQDNIQSYMDQLDKFTVSFAYAVNAIQTGSTVDGASGIDGLNPDKTELIFVVKNSDGSLSSSDTGITAKNITINSKLEKDTSLLNCGEKHVDDVSGDKDGSRALAIADLKNLKIDIGNLKIEDMGSREDFFKQSGIGFAATDTSNLNLVNTNDGTGTKLDEYYKTIISGLATDSKAAQTSVTSQNVILAALENQRLSVSGVSLDEEMSDLIQFQHSYQANAKMINTIDELLDVVINGLKR